MKKQHTPTGKTFDIKTIAEFAAVVTRENLPFIIKDFKKTLEINMAMNRVVNAIQNKVPYEQCLTLKSFNWIDDGKHEMKEIVITDSSDPEHKIVIAKK